MIVVVMTCVRRGKQQRENVQDAGMRVVASRAGQLHDFTQKNKDAIDVFTDQNYLEPRKHRIQHESSNRLTCEPRISRDATLTFESTMTDVAQGHETRPTFFRRKAAG